MSFSRLQARRYRCLKQVDQRLDRFQALVGPNASGKTTFLDVLTLLGDLMRSRGDVQEVILSRSPEFSSLLWMGEQTSFEIALEAKIPDQIQSAMGPKRKGFRFARYELELGLDAATNEIGIDKESFWLFQDDEPVIRPILEFPEPVLEPQQLFWEIKPKKRSRIVHKKAGGNDNYYPNDAKDYKPSYRLGRTRSALANVPPEPSRFGVALWFKEELEKGVQSIVLDSQIIRQPSPPGRGNRFLTDGSNLPWVIQELRRNEKSFRRWIGHVQTALEDVRDINVVVRPEDRHCYLTVEYANQSVVPSWLVSDGTLRLLALTIPAYVGGMTGTFLIEEPENGIHPKAMETVTQSLSSVYEAQVLIATHSPIVMSQLVPEQIICFAKNAEGATDTVLGRNHPVLRSWKRGQPDIGVLAASGILS